MGGGGVGVWGATLSTVFLLIFHENPATRTFVVAISLISFFLSFFFNSKLPSCNLRLLSHQNILDSNKAEVRLKQIVKQKRGFIPLNQPPTPMTAGRSVVSILL